MGNCQAIDASSLVIQHPCGKSDNLYSPVSAAQVINSNPGHYVALLISSTKYDNNSQFRVTRIKLLRPTDYLVLGHVYRLITAKEVTRVLSEKKHAKMMRQGQEIRLEQQQQQQQEEQQETRKPNHQPDVRKKVNLVKDKQEMRQRQQKAMTTNNSAIGRSKSWQPSLWSISE